MCQGEVGRSSRLSMEPVLVAPTSLGFCFPMGSPPTRGCQTAPLRDLVELNTVNCWAFSPASLVEMDVPAQHSPWAPVPLCLVLRMGFSWLPCQSGLGECPAHSCSSPAGVGSVLVR